VGRDVVDGSSWLELPGIVVYFAGGICGLRRGRELGLKVKVAVLFDVNDGL